MSTFVRSVPIACQPASMTVESHYERHRISRWKPDEQKSDALPTDIKVDVINPRYEGATPLMVAKALLQRPPKDKKSSDKVEPEG